LRHSRPASPLDNQPNDTIRKGPRTSAAGGRTSVSAPIPIQPKTPAPMGSQIARAENPIHSPPHNPWKGPRTSAAGGRTSVSAPLLIHPQTTAPMGRVRVGAANAPSGHDLGGCSMTEADESRNMAWHRNDEGPNRSRFALGPAERWSPDKRPAERTQRSAPPPRCLWMQADGLLGGTPSGRGLSRSRLVLCPSGR
jgi:hypothetical protein